MPPEQRAILDRWEANKIAELGKLTFLITGYLEEGCRNFRPLSYETTCYCLVGWVYVTLHRFTQIVQVLLCFVEKGVQSGE